MSTNLNPIKEKTMSKIPIAPDLQLHVRITKADGLELVSLRQFIPSIKRYGRGVSFESAHLLRVLEALQGLEGHVAGFSNAVADPGPDQVAFDV